MTPVLGHERRRGGHGDDDLDDEHDRGDARRGAALERGHLGEEPGARRERGEERPERRTRRSPALERVGDELRGQAAPGERGAGGERHPGPAPDRERHSGDGGENAEHRAERERPGVADGGFGRQCAEQGDAGHDRRERDHVARADALVQVPRADGEQQTEPEGERRLHHGQRREQQRDGLQRPPEDVERRAGQPPAAPRQLRQQPDARTPARRRGASVERLQCEAEVVERRRGACRARPDGDRGHAGGAP
jgi:hypothetical protein